eukprot:2886092-Prymnesium_polylepis.1
MVGVRALDGAAHHDLARLGNVDEAGHARFQLHDSLAVDSRGARAGRVDVEHLEARRDGFLRRLRDAPAI